MSRYSMYLAVGALTLAGAAQAQTATQSVSFEVQAINKNSVTGSPSLVINTATAGSQPTQATYNTSTYSITTNQADRKITASINSDMPSGVTLKVNLTAPAGGSVSTGATT